MQEGRGKKGLESFSRGEYRTGPEDKKGKGPGRGVKKGEEERKRIEARCLR